MRTEDTHRDENRAVNKRGRVKKGFGGFLGGGVVSVLIMVRKMGFL